MKKKVILIFLLVWILAVAVTIFLFSSQSGEASGNASRGLMEKILSFFRLHITDKERAHHFIRKVAHMTEYAVLGASVCILFFYLADMRRCKNVSRIGLAGGAWVFTVLFAVTDEIHQAFVPGRGPSVTDVLIDAVGVAVGIGAVLLGYYGIYLRKHSKKKILPEEKENLR